MVVSLLQRKTFFIILVSILALSLFTACGSKTAPSTSTSSSTPASTTPVSTQPALSPATATVTTVSKLITFVGQPKAKMLAGTTFEVVGQVKNGDSKQHDIYLQATLLDASGTKIATTAIQNVDNVAAGATETFTIQGTTTQPTWAQIQVTIIKVSENIGGSGSD
jgi:PBP1b-binding outer membrane lipoprotein LpoB